MDCSMPGFPVHHQLLELVQTQVHWVGDDMQPSHPLLSPSPLPSIFPSLRVFSSESVLCITWPKYWSFSFSISPSNEYSVLISSRIDWLDLLAVQGSLRRLLQHHSSKGGKGMTEDEMVGWHHWLNGHEFEQTPGDGEGQGSLVCCCPQGHKELDTTERLNNNNKQWKIENESDRISILKEHPI